jgi:sugar porter (SP) family MFS transporter
MVNFTMGFDPLGRVTGRPLVILITIASTCGFLLFGYDNGVYAGLIVSQWFLTTYHHPSSTLLATISAMYNIGGTVGSAIAFFIGNALGRRRTILVGVAIGSIGAIVQCAATKIPQLVSGRIVCGIGVGIMTSTVGLWLGETAPTKTRGGFLSFQLLGGAATGLFLAQWINYGFNAISSRSAFTFPVGFQFIFLATCGLLVAMLPESPRWLVKKDRRDDAMDILVRLQGREGADQRLAQIIEADSLERRIEGNQYRQIFKNGPTQNFRRVCLACGVMIMHQLAGINSVTYYLPTVLIKFIGLSHKTALWVTGLSSLTSMICALVPVLTIDRLGRRGFLWGGALWQAAMFAILAGLLSHIKTGGHSYAVAAVVMIFLYYGGNAVTWLGPSWAYPAEILPLQIREKGLALGNICYWMFQFMIVEITPIAITNIGYKFYIIFAVFNFCIALIVYFFVPETCGLSLEEIDFYFVRKYGNESEVHEIEGYVSKQAAERMGEEEWIETKTEGREGKN